MTPILKEPAMEAVTYALPRDPDAWYRSVSFAGLMWSLSRLEGWQRRWFDIDTDRRSFFGVQVYAYRIGVCR